MQSVQKVMINDKHCFELYGYDVLIDNNLKPWLIECNASPSLTANTEADAEMKIEMLDDVFSVIDMEKILTGAEEQIGGFDLIYKGTAVKLPANSTCQSYLGCHNNRNGQLKRLARQVAQRLSKK
jgi:tubulin polyglutamylase TTLL9